MSNYKENVNENVKRVKAHRKSAPQTAETESSTPNSSELTNEFAGYLDYVRKLEADNSDLKAEKENIILLCKNEILSIKSTYGSEIEALRKALDDLTTLKCNTEYRSEKLSEENTNLKIKYSRKMDALKELEEKYEETEANLVKLRKAVESYNRVCEENGELSRNNESVKSQLKNESNKRVEAENRLLNLNAEIDFLKKVNLSTAAIGGDNSSSVNNKNEAYYREKMNVEMETMREELTEEFNQYKGQLEAAYNNKIEETNDMNLRINDKLNRIYSEKKFLQTENDKLQADIVILQSNITSLNARNVRHSEILTNLNKEHDEFVRDILEENNNLKVKLKELNLEITNLLNEKIATEKETYIFRSMLKGEQSKFNLSDASNPKKRRIEVDNDCNEISAWSKESVKLFCNADYNGNYLQILNDGSNEINLNEWKIEIDTESGTELLYTFPPRIVKAGSFLKVWSLGQNISEDDDNLVMNVGLPPSDIMTCKLNNDMDEVEASFDLKKSTVKRKILKASNKKSQKEENCSMM